MLQNIPTVISGVRCGDAEAVARALEGISQSLQEMTDALKLMHGNDSSTIAITNVILHIIKMLLKYYCFR